MSLVCSETGRILESNITRDTNAYVISYLIKRGENGQIYQSHIGQCLSTRMVRAYGECLKSDTGDVEKTPVATNKGAYFIGFVDSPTNGISFLSRRAWTGLGKTGKQSIPRAEDFRYVSLRDARRLLPKTTRDFLEQLEKNKTRFVRFPPR